MLKKSIENFFNESAVAILPFKREGDKEPLFLGSWEYYPEHSKDNIYELFAITGDSRKDKTPVFTANEVMKRRTGCSIPLRDFVYLGVSTIKVINTDSLIFSDTIMFSVDVTNYDKDIKLIHESDKYINFVTLETLMKSKDLLLYTMAVLSANMRLY